MLDRYPQCKPRALNGEAVYSRPAAGPPGVRQNDGGQSVERAPAERGIKWRVACHVMSCEGASTWALFSSENWHFRLFVVILSNHRLTKVKRFIS